MTRSVPGLEPHKALLLTCATPYADARASHAIEVALSQPEMDWEAAARLAFRHGVAQCLAQHLQPYAADPRLPAGVAACFERLLRANACRNYVLLRETTRLVRRLQAAGIRCLLLKGAALALTAYPDPALRNFADVDILVDREQMAAAGAVAKACGYQPEPDESDASCLHQGYHLCCPEDILTETLPLEFDRDILQYGLQPHRVVVEIHHGLFRDINGMGRMTENGPLWANTQTICAPDDTPLLCPSPEVMLIHLASHAAHHCFGRLMFFMDIAATTQHYGDLIAWDRVIALARQYAICPAVYRSLELARREFGARIPAGVLSELAPASPRQSLTVSYVFSALPGDENTSSVLRYLLLARSRKHLSAALLRTLMLSPATMRRLYKVQNPLLIAALYGLRPLHLAGRLALVLCRHLRGIRRVV